MKYYYLGAMELLKVTLTELSALRDRCMIWLVLNYSEGK